MLQSRNCSIAISAGSNAASIWLISFACSLNILQNTASFKECNSAFSDVGMLCTWLEGNHAHLKRALKVHCFPTHTVYLFEMKSPSVKEKWPSLRSLKKIIPIKKECTSFQAMWHRMNMSIEYVCGKRMQNLISVHITNCIFCGSVVDEVWERAQVSQVPGSLVGDGTSFPISGKGWLRKNARSKRQIWNLQAD